MDGQNEDMLDRLMNEIHARAADLPQGSYTTKLILGGVPKMAEKIIEEAREVVEAAEQSVDAAADSQEHQHLVYEACDLIYHLWVLLGSRGVSVDDLRRELERRSGVSGLVEKAQRKIQ